MSPVGATGVRGEQASAALDLLASALAGEGVVTSNDACRRWLRERAEAHCFVVEPVPLDAMEKWRFDMKTGRLTHRTGRFFAVNGLRVEQRTPELRSWDQPILHQTEIGILGFLVKRLQGVLHFLAQAKMEPGNLLYVQVSPTVQATRSNFTRVHQGHAPNYLEYFLDTSPHCVLVDTLQSEQGSRFLRKLNRNVVVETEDEVPLREDYCWLTLGQLNRLLREDNVVNMDARTVLSCLPLAATELEGVDVSDYPTLLEARCGVDRACLQAPANTFEAACLGTVTRRADTECYADTLRWLNRQRFVAEQQVASIPPRKMRDWIVHPDGIRHREGRFFGVIGVRVEAANREVPAWYQPIIQPASEGLMACFARQNHGRVEVLLQAKAEPGNADAIELGPSVQCFPADYTEAELPPFSREAQDPTLGSWPVNTLQSEEGGRFYREANRNRVVIVSPDWLPCPPDSHRWVSLDQLRPMTLHPCVLNVEARCLLASLAPGAPGSAGFRLPQVLA